MNNGTINEFHHLINSLLRIKIAWAVELYMQGKISSRAVSLAVFSTDALCATHVYVVAGVIQQLAFQKFADFRFT